MQERRVQDRRMQPSRRSASTLPFVALASVLGVAAGFSLALVLDLGSVKLKESPFSPDTGKHIAKGRDFGGAKELGGLSDADRAKFSQSLQLALAGAGPQALDQLAALRKQHPDFCLGHGLAALIQMGDLGSP